MFPLCANECLAFSETCFFRVVESSSALLSVRSHPVRLDFVRIAWHLILDSLSGDCFLFLGLHPSKENFSSFFLSIFATLRCFPPRGFSLLPPCHPFRGATFNPTKIRICCCFDSCLFVCEEGSPKFVGVTSSFSCRTDSFSFLVILFSLKDSGPFL